MARHLLVTNDFPPKTGGIQVYLHELWRRLEPGRAVVVTASSDPRAPQFDQETNVVIERVRARTLYLPTPRALAAIEAAIERHQPDLVLLDPAWPLGLLGPRLSRPYGVVLHGAEVAVPGRIPVIASMLRYVLRHAKVAICAGGYPESEGRRVAAEDMAPVVVVAPGVDTERFTPLAPERRVEVRSARGFEATTFVVSSYSRLVPRKGMDTLIRASARLASEFSNLRVEIGGEGRDRQRLERLARRLDAPVRFHGRVDDSEIVEWLAASDLMVMDCRTRWLGLEQEGFGIVFCEAAATGVAQVAGRSGGSHEAVINDVTGVVVDDPTSDEALADAMRALIVDEGRRVEYGRRARMVAIERFDWDRLAARLSGELAAFDHFEPDN